MLANKKILWQIKLKDLNENKIKKANNFTLWKTESKSFKGPFINHPVRKEIGIFVLCLSKTK